MTVENDAMADTATPRPCPFCGEGEPHPWAELSPGASMEAYFMWCVKCSAKGPRRANRQDAIAAWNRRAHDALKAENAKLREALELAASQLEILLGLGILPTAIEETAQDIADVARATLEGR